MSWSWRRPARRMPAVGLVIAVAVFTLVGTLGAAAGQPEARPLDLLGVVLLLAGPVALAGWRSSPPAVFAVAVGTAAGYLAVGYPYGPVFLAPVVALCLAVVAGYRRSTYTLVAAAFTGLLALHLARNGQSALVGASGWVAFLAAVIAGSEWWRARRERAAQVEATRAEAARRRVSEERLRIARDLHDALGHHISLINVQAGVALHLMDRDRHQARDALEAIKRSSGDLLAEMRATLGMLRGVDEQAPRDPVAGLDRIDDLVADNRLAGLDVTVEIRGTRRGLPTSVDQTAYRIVQEALTNTRRHAGPATADVVIGYGEDELDVRVDDDGTARPGSSESGVGLAGMRERVGALRGTLTAGPRPDGGFTVHARLPIARTPIPAAASGPDEAS